MSNGDLAHILLIIDDEHGGPIAKSSRTFVVPPLNPRLPLREAARQIHLGGCALADRALDPQPAAGLPCQAVNLREPPGLERGGADRRTGNL